jgi:transcriptional regulator with XRE-family HTH domain
MTRPVDPLYVAVGRAVRSRREQLGIAQLELADAVGLTRSSITNLEAGWQQTPLHTLYAIANALEVPVTALLPDRGDIATTATPELGQEDLDRYRASLLAGTARTRRS